MKLTEKKLREVVRKILKEEYPVAIEAGKQEEIEKMLVKMLRQPIIEMAMELEVDLTNDKVGSIAKQVALQSSMFISDEIQNAILNRQ